MQLAYKPKSKNQEHLTPDKIYGEIGIAKDEMYDPCPAGTPYLAPIFFNGLYGDWEQINYVNPPYAVRTLEKFVAKAVEQSKKGKKTWMLLPSKTDQEWFHTHIKDRHINWIRGRLKFKNNKDSATDCHFLVFIKND